MRPILPTVFALALCLGLGLTDAEAKRLGSGRSTGLQRESVSQRQATPPATTTTPSAAPTQATPASPAGPAAAAAPAARRNSWLGPVAGLAAGLGLAALASHFGFGEGLASFMLIALLAMAAVMLVRLLMRRRSEPPRDMHYAGAGGPSFRVQDAPAAAAPAAASAAGLPAGFDADGFVRQAKINFQRLQTANDAGNIDEMRDLTTPEMFTELQRQLQDRGPAPQRTDVVDLHGEVLEYVADGPRHLVSVRFHGLIREEADAAPAHFDEVWHLVKPRDGSHGWVVAGIQPLA